MMRHLFILLLLLPFLIQAQSELGQKFINGSIGVYKSEDPVSGRKGFYLGTSLGYMISDRFATGLGFNFDYGVSKSEFSTAGTLEDIKRNSWGVVPFVSWLKPLTDKFTFNLTAYGSVTSMHSTRILATTIFTNRSTIFTAGLGSSFYYSLSEKLAIGSSFGSLSYSKIKFKRDASSQDSNIFNFSIWDTVTLHCRYIW